MWLQQLEKVVALPLVVLAFATLFGAFTIAGKFSVKGANWLLALTWLLGSLGTYSTSQDTKLACLVSVALGIALLCVSRWFGVKAQGIIAGLSNAGSETDPSPLALRGEIKGVVLDALKEHDQTQITTDQLREQLRERTQGQGRMEIIEPIMPPSPPSDS